MPSWVGRLPSRVGYPAGGSLTADEYKALVLVYCPIIVSLSSCFAAVFFYDLSFSFSDSFDLARVAATCSSRVVQSHEKMGRGRSGPNYTTMHETQTTDAPRRRQKLSEASSCTEDNSWPYNSVCWFAKSSGAFKGIPRGVSHSKLLLFSLFILFTSLLPW